MEGAQPLPQQDGEMPFVFSPVWLQTVSLGAGGFLLQVDLMPPSTAHPSRGIHSPTAVLQLTSARADCKEPL